MGLRQAMRSSDKIEACRAAISVLSEVLQQEIAWMRKACCLMEVVISRMPRGGGESEEYLRGCLHDLVGHYKPIIAESNRLIDAGVND